MHIRCLSVIAAGLIPAWTAVAQPCQWSKDFPYGGLDWPSDVRALAVYDDGGGPHVYAGGDFWYVTGEAKVGQKLGRWDDPLWSSPGGISPKQPVNAMAVFDDGSGPALFVAGEFYKIGDETVRYIAKWDGKAWSYVGTGLNAYPNKTSVHALAVHDDGTGPALYAAGRFDRSGDLSQNLVGIARWDGQSWHDVGGGLALSIGLPLVVALASHDDGSGPALYAGGYFDLAGGQPIKFLARWDGNAWSAVGDPPVEINPGTDCAGTIEDCVMIRGLASFDDGTGPALYAAGHFQIPGLANKNIARFRNGQWEQAGEVFGHRMAYDKPLIRIAALNVLDTGEGPSLYLAGRFETYLPPKDDIVGGCLARWDPATQSWTDLHANPMVKALTVYDEGDGPRVWAGGPFGTENFDAHIIGTLGADGWRRVWDPAVSGDDSNMMVAYDDGSGPAVYLAGNFIGVMNPDEYDWPNHPSVGITRWNGAKWGSVGHWADIDPEINVGRIRSPTLSLIDLGGGPHLYGAADLDKSDAEGGKEPIFRGIVRWDGQHWSKVGQDLTGVSVTYIFDFDDGAGRTLYFLTGNNKSEIWRLDGDTWAKWAQGQTHPEYLGQMFAAIEFDDGSGPAMWISGAIEAIEGVPVTFAARYRPGTGWAPAGNIDQPIGGFYVWDDPGTLDGPALYAGGPFNFADGHAVNGIARWDGKEWQPLGLGLGDPGIGFRFFNWQDGAGRGLYVCGNFDSAGGQPAANIARWDGAAWSALKGGLSGVTTGIAGIDLGKGAGRQIFVTGSFAVADGYPSSGFAVWTPCPEPCPADLDGSGSLDLFDFLTFVNLFSAGDPKADCDGDGVLAAADFACYSALFAAGCP